MLFAYDNNVTIQLSRMQNTNTPEEELIETCNFLSEKSYHRFQQRWSQLQKYSLVVTENPNENVRIVLNRRHNTTKKCVYNQSLQKFECKQCNTSWGFEEQCEHSLIANDGKFLPEVFAIRHQRRTKVASAPIPDSKGDEAEFETTAEPPLEDIMPPSMMTPYMPKEDGDSRIADPADDADYWEESCIIDNEEKCQARPFNRKETQTLLDNIATRLENCSRSTQVGVGAMLVALQSVVTTDSQSNRLQDDVIDFSALIKKHRNTFLPQKNAFIYTGEMGIHEKPSANIVSNHYVSK